MSRAKLHTSDIDLGSAIIIGQHALALDKRGRLFKLTSGTWLHLRPREYNKSKALKKSWQKGRARRGRLKLIVNDGGNDERRGTG